MTQNLNLLLVDDDSLIHETLKLVAPKNWAITSAQSLGEIPSQGFFHAAFVDMHLTKDLKNLDGLTALRTIETQFPRCEVFAMSGDLNMALMEKALDRGAKKFLAKPLSVDEIKKVFDKTESFWNMTELATKSGNIAWVGKGPASQKILDRISQLKGEAGPVLIEGETGAGKEVVSHLLNAQEKARPFITVNVGAIPENLFESEFFGHVRGAFTGADSLKVGLTEAAQGGDLFLDEIEALPLNQQVKLLRFLESGEIRRVGAKESILVKTRVIAASNRSLAQMVKDGEFREDLLFRLSGKKIVLPPLRQRSEDIESLCQRFLSLDRTSPRKILSPEALQTLKTYSWPGNVRELKRICEQLLITSPLPIIRAIDVSRLLESNSEIDQDKKIDLSLGLVKLTEDYEKQIIKKAIDEKAGDIDATSDLLQISRSSLYKKIKDYQIEVIK